MREAIEGVVEDVLRPLLQADASDIQLVEVEAGKVVVRLSGEAAFGAGSHYVRTHVVEPAIVKAAGVALEVVFERSVPNAKVTFGSTADTARDALADPDDLLAPIEVDDDELAPVDELEETTEYEIAGEGNPPLELELDSDEMPLADIDEPEVPVDSPEALPEDDVEAEAEAETEADAEAETEADAGAETEAEAEAETEADAEAETETDAESEATGEAGPDSVGEDDSDEDDAP